MFLTALGREEIEEKDENQLENFQVESSDLFILKVATFAFCCQPILLSLPHLGQDWCCCWNYHSTSLILKIAWNNIRNHLQTSVEQIFARFPFSRQQPIGCECWGAGWTQRASWPASSWAGARTRRTRRGTGRWTPTRSLQIPIFPSHVYFCLFYQQMLSQHLRRRPKPSEDEPKLCPPGTQLHVQVWKAEVHHQHPQHSWGEEQAGGGQWGLWGGGRGGADSVEGRGWGQSDCENEK